MFKFKFVITLFLKIITVFIFSFPAFAMTTQHAEKHAIKRVLLIVAMENEASPIIKLLHLHKRASFQNLPVQRYTGKYHDIELMLVVNGLDPIHKVQNVGTQPAVLSTYLGISTFKPNLVISIGTAGGVQQNGAKLNSIYVSQSIYFFDRRFQSSDYQKYGEGAYPSFKLTNPKKFNLSPGIVCSGDSFDENQTDYNQFLKLHCNAIDMDAAGVAWVSMLTNTPMIAIKGVTNFVKGSNSHQQYEQNLPRVTCELAIQLKHFLTELI